MVDEAIAQVCYIFGRLPQRSHDIETNGATLQKPQTLPLAQAGGRNLHTDESKF